MTDFFIFLWCKWKTWKSWNTFIQFWEFAEHKTNDNKKQKNSWYKCSALSVYCFDFNCWFCYSYGKIYQKFSQMAFTRNHLLLPFVLKLTDIRSQSYQYLIYSFFIVFKLECLQHKKIMHLLWNGPA